MESGAKPFLKWAGGKTQLLSEINKYYPFSSGQITRYAEPFVGGGAVFFDIAAKYALEEVYLGDINPDLINAYIVVKNDVDELARLLQQMQADYISLGPDERKSYFMSARVRFNKMKFDGHKTGDIRRAAIFIFLNKTCFNGLYRVNARGMFNVPPGKYKNPVICDEVNLRSASLKLQRARIVCGDYKISEDFIDEKTFVYLDPPYRPISSTASFTAYSETAFDDGKQIELARFVRRIKKIGAHIVVSNSDPKNTNPHDNFFDCIYSGMRIRRVDATRMINCKSEARGKIKELLISSA